MQIKIDKRFAKKLRARVDRYQFEVGILQDRPYRRPLSKKAGLGSLRGGPVRKKSLKTNGHVSDASEAMRKRTNFYRAPFQKPSNDLRRFTREVYRLAFGHGGLRHRAVSHLRALIRNPILRGTYGSNAASTQRTKGFNRFMIDTGQLFRTIAARVRVKRNVSK